MQYKSLSFIPPYDWHFMLAFLSRRATPGVERVSEGKYIRSICLDQQYGFIEIDIQPKKSCLKLGIEFSHSNVVAEILKRITALLDLGTVPGPILATLKQDPILWPSVQRNPGLRKPGCWDSFEIAVRAITGQQISVTGATTVMGRIIEGYGSPTPAGFPVSHIFPTPQQLAELDTRDLPMPRARAETIRSLALAMANEQIQLDSGANHRELLEQLLAIKGIGPWTAQYIAMRALNDADALLEGDLVLEKAAGKLYGVGQRMDRRELIERAEQWRPYRAYACLHLWNLASGIQ